MIRTSSIALVISIVWLSHQGITVAVPHYSKGRVHLGGLTLLRDAERTTDYYYLPTAPRIATTESGHLRLLCMEYLGKDGESGGGIFHAVLECSAPQSALEVATAELRRLHPNARIVGPVPLLPPSRNPDSPDSRREAECRLISAILQDEQLTRKAIVSSISPIHGRQISITASLTPTGSKLLWQAVQGAHSGVMVELSATYEARVDGQNVLVNANLDSVYRHLSTVVNRQKVFRRRHLKQVVDELVTNQVVKITNDSGSTLARSGIGDDVLDRVTNAMIERLFDTKSTWAVEPNREAAVEHGQILGRQRPGLLSRIFGGAKDYRYTTDDQLVLKDMKDVVQKSLILDLSHQSVVRVPFEVSGCLSVAFEDDTAKREYFQVVDLADSTFERVTVQPVLAAGFASAFPDVLGHALIRFRRQRPDGSWATAERVVKSQDIRDGTPIEGFDLLRLGDNSHSWVEYEYQILWGFTGQESHESSSDEAWIHGTGTILNVRPPLKRQVVTINSAGLSAELNYRLIRLELASSVAGTPSLQRRVDFDAELPPLHDVVMYHDPESVVIYRVLAIDQNGRATRTAWQKYDRSMIHVRVALESDPNNHLEVQIAK